MIKLVEPSIYIISQPRINWLEVDQFLGEYDPSSEFDFDTDATDSESLAEFGGRLCYMSFNTDNNDNITKTIKRSNLDYLQKSIIANKHFSVLEHSNISILIDNISVLATHELVRHRIASYSQLSGRYVRTADIGFYIPTCISEDPIALGLFLEALEHTHQYYLKLVNHFGLDEEQDFGRKKTVTSALRRLLGQGRASKILVTANIRAWRHMIEIRTSEHAEEEIALVFRKIFTALKAEHPAFFDDAVISDKGEVIFGNSKV